MRSTGALLVLLLIVLMVSACASDATAEVLPFEEIVVEAPEFEFDPSGTQATLRVETSIDAVCAVTYGVGEPVGQIATDSDMSAGGHSEHAPVLAGLEPDTEYQYRLQGVGSDGQLYRSEVLTFRTPPAEESGFGENLATRGTVVRTSSEFSGDFAAENAIDGDLATEWSTDEDGDDAFIVIDLGEETNIGAVAFRTREMTDGSATTRTFTITVEGETHGPYPAGPDPVEVSLSASRIKIDVEESTGGNTGAVEIEVYRNGRDGRTGSTQ